MTTRMREHPVLAVGIVIGLGLGVAEVLARGAAWQVAIAAGFPIAYAAIVTLVAPRSEAASLLAGRPVDERAEHINLEASAWALGLTAVVVLAAFAVAEASGNDWGPYAFIATVMALAYVGSLLVVRLRH